MVLSRTAGNLLYQRQMATLNLGWGEIANAPGTQAPPQGPFMQANVGTTQLTQPRGPLFGGPFGSAPAIQPSRTFPSQPLSSAPGIARGVWGNPENIYAAPSRVAVGDSGNVIRYDEYKPPFGPNALMYPSRSVQLASNPGTAGYVHSSTACSSSFEGFAERLTSILTRNPVTKSDINEALNLMKQCADARLEDAKRHDEFNLSHQLAYNKVSNLGNFVAAFYNRFPLTTERYPTMEFQNVGHYFVVDFDQTTLGGRAVERVYIDGRTGVSLSVPPSGGRRKTRKLRKTKRATRRKRLSSRRK